MRTQARRLLDHLERSSPLALRDIAHTLQVGREAFSERLALPVADLVELRQRLGEFADGKPGTWLRGSVIPDAVTTETTSTDRMEWRRLAMQGDWTALARLWVAGRQIPWTELGVASGQRIALPTYPFAHQSCWLPTMQGVEPPRRGAPPLLIQGGEQSPGALHPLLDRCLPALHEARFAKRFTGNEGLLRDHQVKGARVLPGVAHLEMARAAAALTLERPVSGLSQVTWLRPFIVGDDGREVRLTLCEKDGVLGFTVADTAKPAQVYSQGVVIADPPPAALHQDLAVIRQRCPNRLDHAQIYALLTAQGVDYGLRLQRLETLSYGTGEVLAQWRPEPASDWPVTGWNPELLDAALQSLMGIFLAAGQTGARLPHTLGALTVHGDLATARFIHVQARGSETLCDVWLLDERGRVVLTMEELALRAPAMSSAPLSPIQKVDELPGFLDLEEIGRLELLAFFQQAGCWRRSGEVCEEAQLRQQLAVSTAHLPLLAALIAMLEQAGLLSRQGHALIATDAVDHSQWRQRLHDRARLAQELAIRYPALQPHLQLLQRCLAQYPALLRGELAATEVFFPDGSLDTVEGIYRGYGLADHFHTVLAGELRQAVDHWLAAGEPEPIRILEIGAGTGGTTGHVLQALAGRETQIEYLYTDLSPRFTQHGRQRFGQAGPTLHFQMLDIERDPLAQGFTANSCHVILASNVLHATRDIAVTLNHVRTLLKPGGRLLINEMTANRDFATLTFGLLEGWWRATDQARRLPYSPLLDVAGWQEAFRDCGLTPLAAHGEPGVTTPARYQQSVLVSELRAAVAVESAPALEDLIAHTLTSFSSAPVVMEASTKTTEAAQKETMPVVEFPLLGKEGWRVSAGVVPSEALAAAVEAVISEQVAEVFEMSLEQVRSGRVMSFTDFGADSILSAELVAKLNTALELNLKTTAIFNYPGIRELTGYLCEDFGETLRTRLLPGVGTSAEPVTPLAPIAETGASLADILQQLEAGAMDYETALAQFSGELLEEVR